MKLKKLNILTIILLSLPAVLAQNGVQGALTGIFSSLQTILEVDELKFGLTFIAFFIILYGIFAAGLQIVPAFKDDGKLSRNGKLVAVGFSLLGNVGVFLSSNGRPADAVANLLSAFGFYAAIFVGIIIFLMLYFALKDTEFFKERVWELLICYLGIALLLGGTIVPAPEAKAWGVVALTIGIVFLIISLFSGATERALDGPAGRMGSRAGRSRGGLFGRGGRPPREQGPTPGPVEWDDPQYLSQAVELSWKPNPASDNVTKYVIERITTGLGKWGRRATFRSGWKPINTVSEVYTNLLCN